jgi:phage terminase small subunit
MDFSELTDKQRRFCEEYIVDWNASRSALAAGYSEKTAYQIGHENLKKVEIQAYIEHIQKDLKKQAGMSVLSNLKKVEEILLDKDARNNDKLKAVEIINKMLGFNAPDKSEVDMKGEISNTGEVSINFNKKK